jgi:hydrogenase-4 component F
MMIKILLALPIVMSVILFMIRSKKLNSAMIVLYSLLYLCLTFYIFLVPQEQNNDVFGLYLRVDPLNILFLLVLGIVFVGVAIYNVGYMKGLETTRHSHTYYSLGVILFVSCMTGTLLSTHLGLSWVFIEATTLASAYLVYFNKTKHALEAAWKYVFICSIGISLAFVGIILLSIGTGHINSLFFDDLYSQANKIVPIWLKLSFAFTLVGFGTKMGLAPVHAWLPDAHSEAPSPISALLSAALLNSAFLIILRLYKLMELTDLGYYARILLLVMGILSLFVTAVFVFGINNYKRMLAYSSIENMGIITIGIAVGGPGIFAAMLHLVGHSLVKSSFFLTSGNILHIFQTKKIDEVGGIVRTDKLTGWLWVICFIAIAGLPPFSLFISEFLVVRTMFADGHSFLAIGFLLLLTVIIYGIGKSVFKMSFGNLSAHHTTLTHQGTKLSWNMYLPQVILLMVSLMIGLYMPGIVNKLLESAEAVIKI